MSPSKKLPWPARWDRDRPAFAVPAGDSAEIVVDGLWLEREPDRVVQLRLTVAEAAALAWALVQLVNGYQD